ncbi:hypothetical protein [Gracilibacillus dipsosauri]|uniref:hypothetical protein n=1 Tax=Gracilibacillus dipsosauri TaxID=178340 RepID=UPI00240A5460
MLKDHPVIERMERYGYMTPEPATLGRDSLGNEVIEGDVLYELDDKTFVAEEISFDASMVLKLLGAERKIAQ